MPGASQPTDVVSEVWGLSGVVGAPVFITDFLWDASGSGCAVAAPRSIQPAEFRK